MDPATLLNVAQTILLVLDSSFVKNLASVRSFKSQVSKLKHTMSTINAALADAEERERQLIPRSNVECDWLEKLRDVVYETDDLLDEISYVAQHKQLMSGDKLIKEVHFFFSRFNQLAFAIYASREVKKIRERLDGNAKDHHDFGFLSQNNNGGRIVTKRREESHSFVYIEDVIGRDEDKRAVLDMLLDSSVLKDVYFVTIVGMGGLGKTTLAQLVYNDEMIMREFPLRLWVCVSDEFDVKEILCKLLGSTNQNLQIEELQRRFQRKIKAKRYLLVLDDVWNEDRHKWLKLRDLLICGGRGSRVLVTSRSKLVATTIEDGLTYELRGLSPEYSWCLFEKMAFRNVEERTDVDLIEIGQHILNKCANVPLAIRVVGSLLHGQSKSTWVSFRNKDLMKMKKDDKDGILPILKLSYHHLTLPLKSCFSYCAIFPKDYRIEKDILIGLWTAHGFFMPLEGQRAKDAGDDYFMILIQRCFLQDAEVNEYGEIVACKIHDLMHDLAREVAGGDVSVVDSVGKLMEKTRHISFGEMEIRSILGSRTMTKVENFRTFFKLRSIHAGTTPGDIRKLATKARHLRVLCLSQSSIRSLPSAIRKLIHLRYLDLSYNYELEFLPTALGKVLHNLQTLILKDCCYLKELPRNLRKLDKLRYLDIDGCRRLGYMPPGMSNLTFLEMLPQFVVSYSPIHQAHRGKLKDLEGLTNLGGSLKITLRGFSTYEVTEGDKYVKGMKHLKDIYIEISCLDESGSMLLLEALQPDCNLRCFHLSGYKGLAFPRWESMEDLGTSLPNLVDFSLYFCGSLQHLPLLCSLRCLKILSLSKLDNLEYVESSGRVDDVTSFPCLEKLHLEALPKLKQWRKSSSESREMGSNFKCCPVPYSFPRLFDLSIRSCPYLTSIPLISNVESLILSIDRFASPSSTLLSSCCLTRPHELTIKFSNNEHLKSLSIVEELFRSQLSSSLVSLHIEEWSYLKGLQGGGLEHLTALQTLHLLDLNDLEKLEYGNPYNMLPWESLSNLRHLELQDLPKLVNLPLGIQHLTALQTLHMRDCESLKHVPVCVSCLTSLQRLYIYGCDKLTSLPGEMCSRSSLEVEIKNCEGLENKEEPTQRSVLMPDLYFNPSQQLVTRGNVDYLPAMEGWQENKRTGNDLELDDDATYWRRLQRLKNRAIFFQEVQFEEVKSLELEEDEAMTDDECVYEKSV